MPRHALLPVAMLVITACDRPTPAERRTVEEWLLCEECTAGELDSVVALGDRAVPLLERALEGPDQERRVNMQRQARAMWLGMPDTLAALVALETFLARYDSNYVASYQSRAAIALDSLGSREARRILLEALREDEVRADVRRALGRSVGAQLLRIGGDGQHAPLDSFVKVNPSVLVRDSASGAGLAGVPVRFSVDSGHGHVIDSVEVTDTGGRAEVRWRLGPQPQDSVNLLRAVAAGRAVRFHARAHTPELRVVFVVQPRDAKVGQPILPPVRIEVHDAWGALQTQLDTTALVAVAGTSISSAHAVVDGVAHIAGFSLPMPGTDLVLRARVAGAEPAVSAPFDIVP